MTFMRNNSGSNRRPRMVSEDDSIPFLLAAAGHHSYHGSVTPVTLPQPALPIPARRRYHREVFATFVAWLGAMSFGMAVGFSSPALNDLIATDVLSPGTMEAVLFSSLVTIGPALSCIPAGYIVDVVGRKVMLLFTAVPLTFGWFLIVLNCHVSLLLLGRCLTGVGVGLVSVICPLYIGEVTSASVRGRLASGYQLFVMIGSCSSFALALWLSWQWLAMVISSVAALLAVLSLFIVESPRWHLRCSRRSEALNSLTWLRGGDKELAVEELAEMEQHGDVAHTDGTNRRRPASLRTALTEPRFRRPLMLAVGLMLLQQFCGINAVTIFLQQIVADTGLPQPAVLAVANRACGVIATFLASTIVVDRYGRKVLIIISGILVSFACASLGLYFFLHDTAHISVSPWWALGAVMLFSIGFAMGLGPVPWVIMGEIIPLQVRGLASGITSTSNWVCAFIVSFSFTYIESSIGLHGAFWIYAFLTIVGTALVTWKLPETKGKPLEAIEALFS